MPSEPLVTNYVNAVGVGDVKDVTLSLDTNAYASADVLAAPQEVTNFFRRPGGRAYLHSILVLDVSDQGTAFDLLFMNATGSIGAENAAFSPTDAVAGTILASVSVTAADFVDAINSQYAIKTNIGQMIKCAAGTTSVWVAAVCRSGTPTYAADGLQLKISAMWD